MTTYAYVTPKETSDIYAVELYNGVPQTCIGPIELWQAEGSDPSGYDWENSKDIPFDEFDRRPDLWPGTKP